jgi:hypothetical protein
MAKLPSSFRARNRTSENFRRQYEELQESVQNVVREACKLFDRNPAHRSLRHHELKDTKKGKHVPGSFSVSPTMQHRAIYIPQDGINIWYWIGTHAEYKVYTGSSK